MMTLEIIIPTKDRITDLEETLYSISRQTVLPKKIFIVDAGQTHIDHLSFHILFNSLSVNYNHIFSHPSLTHQRNIGIKQISEDLILFLDDDVLLEHDYLEKIIDVFIKDKSNEIGGATGKCLNNTVNKSIFSNFIRKLFLLGISNKGEVLRSGASNSISESITNQIEVDWLAGFNMIYRKEVFSDMKFDEHLFSYSYMEDLDFSYRVRKIYKLIYQPSAKLIHKKSPVSRIGLELKSEMYVTNLHYLFKKNIDQSIINKILHFWSLFGIMIQNIFLKNSYPQFKGALIALYKIIKNT